MTASLLHIPLKRIDGTEDRLANHAGKVLLIVNVASNCGLTPQYTGLQALHQQKHPKGLEVLGFPANNFMGQEPGSDAEIIEFCTTQYDVHFPLFSKISVGGGNQHPLYAQLIAARPSTIGDGPFRKVLEGHGISPAAAPQVLWNFEKFLLNRRGDVVARFAPDIIAEDPRLVAAIDAELALKV